MKIAVQLLADEEEVDDGPAISESAVLCFFASEVPVDFDLFRLVFSRFLANSIFFARSLAFFFAASSLSSSVPALPFVCSFPLFLSFSFVPSPPV